MLVQFSVKNFMSFKDKVSFSMEAGMGNENEQNIYKIDNMNERILKSAAIYGANASGKTNLINAFTAAIRMVRNSSHRQVGEKLIEMVPFAFDEETVSKPCEFEFIFFVNGLKYVYGFSADKDKIYEEYLYQYLTAKPTRIFERENVDEYKFLQSDEGKLNAIKAQNTENKLFLSTATMWNYSKTKDVFLWFADNIDTYLGGVNLDEKSIEAYENDKDGRLKQFALKLLKISDIFIKTYDLETREINLDADVMLVLNGKTYPAMSPKKKDIKITMTHEVKNDMGELKEYQLNYKSESLGTQIIFSLAPILMQAFEKGNVVVMDEIERSLHPSLVEMIIRFFNDTEINKGNAQLIFSTHDTNLLSLDLFRRDQIWFAEKDNKKGATDIYPLDDFSVRKTENIQKGYLNGRYGAIPFVAMGDSLWED